MTEKALRIGAVAQARNGSSRFPRKVFADIAGHPVLWYLIERLKRCKRLDEIVIATSTAPEDAEIAEYAENAGVQSFLGSEWDVQERFLGAAEEFELDVIVRICGDSPFIDPEMIDLLVGTLIRERADYAEPDPTVPAAYEGMEAVTARALRRARMLGDEGPDREHVTLYIRRHPDQFRLAHPVPDPETRGRFRLSVDNHADLAFARAAYSALYREGEVFSARELAAYLREHPETTAFNAHVRQKDTAAKNFHVAFCVTHGESVDALLGRARKLNEEWHCGIAFFGALTPDEVVRLQSMGYRTAAIDLARPFASDPHLAAWHIDAVLLPKGDAAVGPHLRSQGWKTHAYDEAPEKYVRL